MTERTMKDRMDDMNAAIDRAEVLGRAIDAGTATSAMALEWLTHPYVCTSEMVRKAARIMAAASPAPPPTPERRFKVLNTKETVPWSLVASHEDQARKNHDQSLERLNERGGLDWVELLAVVTDRPWQDVLSFTEEAARDAVLALVEVLPPAPLSAQSSLVAGDVLLTSLANFASRCEVHLADEQAKPNPDNALIAVLCDGVRMAREFGDRPPLIPLSAQPTEDDIWLPCPFCGQPGEKVAVEEEANRGGYVVTCRGCAASTAVVFPSKDTPDGHLRLLWNRRFVVAAPSPRETALRAALAKLLERYTALVNCGDCGSWNPEEEQEVIAARAALSSTEDR